MSYGQKYDDDYNMASFDFFTFVGQICNNRNSPVWIILVSRIYFLINKPEPDLAWPEPIYFSDI